MAKRKKDESTANRNEKKEELLVDYFENASAFFGERKSRLHELEKHYNESYSRDIKDEMNIIKEEIKKKRAEFVDKIYENSEELRYLKKYFPDFFAILLEEPEIGKIIKKHDLLFDNLEFPQPARRLMEIRRARMQLKDAIKFLEKWPSIIKKKQLTATYPLLEGEITRDMESSEAVEKLKEMDRALKREGWKAIISDLALLRQVAERYVQKRKKLDIEILQLSNIYEDAKGKGTVAEYNALKRLENAKKKREKLDRFIRRLMLANTAFLDSLKKSRNWLSRSKKSELEKIAESVASKKIREKIWLEWMRRKLA